MRLTGCSLMQPAYIRRCSVCTKDRRTDRRTDTSEKRVPAARTVRLPAARVGPVRCGLMPHRSWLLAVGGSTSNFQCKRIFFGSSLYVWSLRTQ